MKQRIITLLVAMIWLTGTAAAQQEHFAELLRSNLSDFEPDGQNPFSFDHKGCKKEIYAPINTSNVYFGVIFEPKNANSEALENAKQALTRRHADIVCLINDNKASIRYKKDFGIIEDETADQCARIALETESPYIYANLRGYLSELQNIYTNEVNEIEERQRKEIEERQRKEKEEMEAKLKQQEQQQAPPYLTADGPKTIGCEGGVSKYEIKTNTEYNIDIPASCSSWLRIRNKKLPIDKELYLLEVEYDQNTQTTSRTGQFRIYNDAGNSTTLYITQEGKKIEPPVVTVVNKKKDEKKERKTKVVESESTEKKQHFHHHYIDHFWSIKFGPNANFWKFYDSDGKSDDKNFNDQSIPQIGYNLMFCYDDLIGGPIFWGLNFGFTSNGYRLDYTKGDNEDIEYLLSHSIQFSPHFGLTIRMGKGFALEAYAGPYVGYDYFGMGKNTWKYNGSEYSEEFKIWDDTNYWYDGGYKHLQYGYDLSAGFWFGKGFNINVLIQQGLSDIVKQSNGAHSRNLNAMARLGFRL